MQELRLRGVDDVLLFAGGIIPTSDVPALEQLGFQAIFRPGSSMQDIVDFVRTHARHH